MRPRGKATTPVRATGAPFLHSVQSLPEKFDPSKYPFNIHAFSHGTRDFLNSPERFFEHLFGAVDGDGKDGAER